MAKIEWADKLSVDFIKMGDGNRKLSAIVFTDIAGFTELSAQNEPAALALLKAQRELLAPKVEEFGGHWLKEMGDGLLLNFDSTLAAASCAVWMQTLARDVPGLDLRIGIHVGDVMVQGDDVLGDGVNVASRIEPASPIGGIALSPRAQQDLASQPEFETELVGIASLKGVSRPMEVYCIISHGLPGKEHSNLGALKVGKDSSSSRKPLIAGIAAGVLALGIGAFFLWPGGDENPGNPNNGPATKQNLPSASTAPANFNPPTNSIVVIPFDNFGDKEKDQGITDGMTELITMHLGKMREVKVTSRNTAMHYRDKKAKVSEVGRDLNVAWALEGSVQRTGDQVRVVAQLINTSTDEHVWAEEYARPASEFAQIQSEIAAKIAAAFRAELTPDFKAYLARQPTTDLALFEEYMRGREAWMEMTRDSLEKAERIFLGVIERDQKFALAFAGLAEVFNTRINLKLENPKDLGPKAKQYASKAVELDPESSEAHAALAYVTLMHEWDMVAAEKQLLRALELNPNNSIAHLHYSKILLSQRWYALALKHNQIAAELDPLNPQIMFALSELYGEFKGGQNHRRSFEIIDELKNRLPKHPEVILQRIDEYSRKNNSQLLEYIDQMKKSDPANPSRPIFELMRKLPEVNRSNLDHNETLGADYGIIKTVAQNQYVPSEHPVMFHLHHSKDPESLAWWLEYGMTNRDILFRVRNIIGIRKMAQVSGFYRKHFGVLLDPIIQPVLDECEELLVEIKDPPWIKKGDTRYEQELEKANNGDARAQYWVGNYIAQMGGRRTEEDMQIFETMAEKSAASGTVLGQWLLSRYERFHREGTIKSNEICVEILPGLKAIGEQDSTDGTEANFALFWIYKNAWGVEADSNASLIALRKAANGGNPRAQWSLAFQLYRGDLVTRDLVEAKKWAGLAAREGVPQAMNLMINLHKNKMHFGEEQEQETDHSEALFWAILLAHHGNEFAERLIVPKFNGHSGNPPIRLNLDERLAAEQRTREFLGLPDFLGESD